MLQLAKVYIEGKRKQVNYIAPQEKGKIG
jgi:hypothetical protein